MMQQPPGEFRDPRLNVEKGDVLEIAQLKVLPLLGFSDFLASDHLLDLLFFLVDPNDVAPANGLA